MTSPILSQSVTNGIRTTMYAGVSRDNAWRGDDYEPHLRAWITQAEKVAA